MHESRASKRTLTAAGVAAAIAGGAIAVAMLAGEPPKRPGPAERLGEASSLTAPDRTATRAVPEPAGAPEPDPFGRRRALADARSSEEPADDREPGRHDAAPRDPDRWRYADIEELKQALYALDIDSIEQLDLLDEFVTTDGEDPVELWDTGWAGVDDWKRYEDGFRLERTPDGALLFVPDEEAMRTYSFFESTNTFEYDDATQAFYNEVDYYGKPVVNVVKFLREDVLVRMTVSGEKVDLNIYGQDQDRRNLPAPESR